MTVRAATVAELREALEGDPPPELRDVRSGMEFRGGHVPGAHLGLAALPEGDAPIWLICASGNRSARAAAELARTGRTVVNVTGGTQAWAAQGWPLARPSGGGRSWTPVVVALLVALTLGLAPFTPEPHLVGKLRWLVGGAEGMGPTDWFDLVLHGAPWLWLAWALVSVVRQR